MTNHAAQTMPELPEPLISGGNDKSRPDLGRGCTGYTAAQVQQYAIDYAAALALSRGVPADMVVVPRELTTSMAEAAEQEFACGNDFSDAWEAAIATYIFDNGTAPAADSGVTQAMLDAGTSAMMAFRKSGGDWTDKPAHAAEAAIRAAFAAAAPAAAGAQGEDGCGACGNGCKDRAGCKLAEQSPPIPQPAAADGGVRERARELLAKWYRAAGRYEDAGRLCMSGTAVDTEENIALLAVEDALSSHRQAGDERPLGYTALFNAIAAATWPATEGVAINVSVAKFHESIGGNVYTAPPPGPDLSKFRELAEGWSQHGEALHANGFDVRGAAMHKCARELLALVEKGASNG